MIHFIVSVLFLLATASQSRTQTFSSWASFIQSEGCSPGTLAYKKARRELVVIPTNTPVEITLSNPYTQLDFYCFSKRSNATDVSSYLSVTVLLFWSPGNSEVNTAQERPNVYLLRKLSWREKVDSAIKKCVASSGFRDLTLNEFVERNQWPASEQDPLQVYENTNEGREVSWHAFPLYSQTSTAKDFGNFLSANLFDPVVIRQKLALNQEAIHKLESYLFSFVESPFPSTAKALAFSFNTKGADAVWIHTASRASPEYSRTFLRSASMKRTP